MKELNDLLEPIESEYVVMTALYWILMRYVGLWDNITFGGSGIDTYIDEIAIIIAVLIAMNLIISLLHKIYKLDLGTSIRQILYQIYKSRKPSWETYEPQTKDLRKVHNTEGWGKIVKRFEHPTIDGLHIREVETEDGTDYELLKEN